MQDRREVIGETDTQGTQTTGGGMGGGEDGRGGGAQQVVGMSTVITREMEEIKGNALIKAEEEMRGPGLRRLGRETTQASHTLREASVGDNSLPVSDSKSSEARGAGPPRSLRLGHGGEGFYSSIVTVL